MYLIFLVYIQMIDVILLLFYNLTQHYIIIPKIIVNFVIIILILAKKGRLQYTLLHKLLLFAKILAIILPFLVDGSHFSVFLILIDENEIRVKPSLNFLSGILVKIGFLVITIK